MLFSTFMTPVSAGSTGGPDFVSAPVAPVLLDIDLSSLVQATSLQERFEFREGFRLPPDPEWEPSSSIETTASETNYKAISAQLQPLVAVVDGAFGTPVLSFEGIPNTGLVPPDPNGDVGPNHYIQMVNSQFQIFDKSGNSQVGPSNINSLWVAANTNDACEFNNDGDPIVQYDHLADRWLMSQFVAFTNQCIAISQTGDPVAGGWILYNFPTPVNNDYFKFGVWPDAYYMGTNGGYPQAHAWAFDRTNMLLANAATFQVFTLPTDGSIMLPSNLDGPTPPAGAPNVFMRFVEGAEFGGVDRLELAEFHVDFATPALSTFTFLPDLPTAPFDSVLCSLVPDPIGVACIPQPNTNQELDTLRGFTMYPLQYRNFGVDETLVVTHNVDVDGNDLAGVRWYEVRKEAGVWSIFQQGTQSPDDTHRWIGSAAMDSCKNIALGYSVTSDTVFPGISYAGRLANDPLGTMPQGEYSLIAGTGSQTNSFRYGDYSSMTIDPVDNRSFWYTSEYINANGQWQTRIAQLVFDNCILIEAEKSWTQTDYNWDPICTLVNPEPPFNCLQERPRETDIPSDDVLADPLPKPGDKYILNAHAVKNKIKAVTPGAFYALTTIEIKTNLDSLTIDEIYGDCYDNQELIKFVSKNKESRNVKVAVADSDGVVTELSDDIYDGIGGQINVIDHTHAEIEITDPDHLKTGNTLYVLVKFQHDLKNASAPGNTFDEMCDNTEEVTASLLDQDSSVTAEASLRITTG